MGNITAKLVKDLRDKTGAGTMDWKKELNENEISKIKNDLSQTFGSDIKLNYNYDPDLIGGLIMQVESIMIDTSIKNKLQQIENKMIEA